MLVAGCGGDEGSSQLDPTVAARLADQSDAVAQAIEANDGCAAAQRVAELKRSLESSAVPDTIRREAEPLASRTFTCAPPPPPPPPPPAAVSTEEGDDDGHGKAKGPKKDKQKKHKKHRHDDEGDE